MSDLEFSLGKACYAAGAAEDAVKIRRREGHIFGSQPGDPEAVIKPIGRGPGKGLAMPLSGVVQLAVAERLIEAGQSVPSSYLAAFRFAFGGRSAPYWLPTYAFRDQAPEFNPKTDRAFGKLFSIGETWLVVAPGGTRMPDDKSCEYFSDDPAFKIDGGSLSSLNSVALRVGEPVDGKPRILLNVSDVCRNLADRLEIPFSRFEREAD